MPDIARSPKMLSEIYDSRRQARDIQIDAMNAVEQAISGNLPMEYEGMFTPTDIRIQLQTTRSAYDTLRKYLAEVPILPHVDGKDSQTGRNKAEVVEKVLTGYHNGAALRGGPGFDTLATLLADYQVAFYDAVMLVHPDFSNRSIFFEVKDPRCHYPPQGYAPWSMAPLDHTLLVYEKTLGEIKRLFAYDSYGMVKQDVMTRLNNAYGKNRMGDPDDSQKVKLGVYRSREAWYVAALGDTDVVLTESQTGDRNHPGATGVVSFAQHGIPLLTGQIGIEAALMKVMNQQIQNTERINKAPMVGPPLLGDTLRWGEYNVVDLSLMQGRYFQPQRMAPDSPNNLTQVMGSLMALAEKFNYNPESAQGGGPAVSGKAIQQLQAGPRSLVTNILFSPYKTAFPRAYEDGMTMEMNLWPNERKKAFGRKGRSSFEVDYTPSVALSGFKGKVRLEEPRMGGYNAFLEAVQKKDAGMASLRSVIEKDPDVRDVEGEIRRIESESVDKFVSAAFEALGSQDPMTAIRAAVEVNKRIANGKSKAEAIQEIMEKGILAPPQPEPPPVPEEMMGPMAAMMGAPPSLDEVAI